MLVYTEKAIYDDPWSYCEDRYRIAGQWYGKCLISHHCIHQYGIVRSVNWI